MPYSAFSQFWPPASKFNESDVPDLTGKVACVTGSNVGIGKEAARVLLEHGAKVYLACRSEEKALATIEELKKVTRKDDVHFLKLDLGDITASKAAAEELISKEPKLHLLVNNAGIGLMDSSQKTVDGYELHWGTNVLGHFVFTETLIPILKAAVASSPTDSVRIVTTSSATYAQAPPGGVNLKDQCLGGTGGFTAYSQSKIGNIFIAQYWAEELKSSGILSFSLHNLISNPTPKGAITQLYAGTLPEVTLAQSGAFFVPWAKIDTTTREELRDETIKGKVIELIKKQVAAVLV